MTILRPSNEVEEELYKLLLSFIDDSVDNFGRKLKLNVSIELVSPAPEGRASDSSGRDVSGGCGYDFLYSLHVPVNLLFHFNPKYN